MRGTPDSPGGFYSTRSQETLDAHGPAQEELEKIRKEILDATDNSRVKKILSLSTLARSETELGRMAVYSEEQRRVANDQMGKARIGDATSNATSRINDLGGASVLSDGTLNPAANQVVTDGLVVVAHEVQDEMDRNGITDPVVQTRSAEIAQTAYLDEVIKAANEKNPRLAEAIFKRYKEMIDGQLHAKIQSELDAGLLRQVSQETAATLITKHPKDLKAQIDEARDTIDDQQMEDAVITRLKAEATLAKNVSVQQEKERIQLAWNEILSGKSLDDLPPQLVAALPRTEHQALQKFQTARLDGRSGYAEANDPAIVNELETMGKGLVNVDMLQGRYISGLTREKWESIVSKKQTLLSGSDADKAAIQSVSQLRTGITRRFGLDAEDGELLKEAFDDQILLFKEHNGQWPDEKQARDIRDNLGREFVGRQGTIFGIGIGGLVADELRNMTRSEIAIINVDAELSTENKSPAQIQDDRDAVASLLWIPESALVTVLKHHPEDQPKTIGALRTTANRLRAPRN